MFGTAYLPSRLTITPCSSCNPRYAMHIKTPWAAIIHPFCVSASVALGPAKRQEHSYSTKRSKSLYCVLSIAPRTLNVATSRGGKDQDRSSKHAAHNFAVYDPIHSEPTIAQVNVKNLGCGPNRLYSCNSQIRQNRQRTFEAFDIGPRFNLW